MFELKKIEILLRRTILDKLNTQAQLFEIKRDDERIKEKFRIFFHINFWIKWFYCCYSRIFYFRIRRGNDQIVKLLAKNDLFRRRRRGRRVIVSMIISSSKYSLVFTSLSVRVLN